MISNNFLKVVKSRFLNYTCFMLFTEDFFALRKPGSFACSTGSTCVQPKVKSWRFIHQGLHNTHAGPDFQNARIRIGETTWAGNAELHLSSSDWQRHGHTTDNAYDNVILHVVYRDDEPLIRTDGRRVPTLELKDRISPDLYNRYHNLVFGNQTIIPCEATIATVDGLTMQNWLTRDTGRAPGKTIGSGGSSFREEPWRLGGNFLPVFGRQLWL
jgi:hypothetical protein